MCMFLDVFKFSVMYNGNYIYIVMHQLLDMGFRLVTGFTEHLKNVNTSNYNTN
jgi:hypothetical protein